MRFVVVVRIAMPATFLLLLPKERLQLVFPLSVMSVPISLTTDLALMYLPLD
jgi:hypothetical protein